MSIALTTSDGHLVYIHQPTAADVDRVVASILANDIAPSPIPRAGSNCVSRDNSAWILSRWLTGNWRVGAIAIARELERVNPAALRLMVESYMTWVDTGIDRVPRSYEYACCDGSTGVPDNMRPCGVRTKDPDAMAHDFAFDLHHAEAPDAFGHVWTFDEANQALYDIRKCAGKPRSALYRWIGVELAGRFYWNRNQSRGGLS